ncbi:MAG: carbon monoxide dehydrogenase [Acidobacteria bacterium RIFCSPLOWO2_02_FULL_68_18]|nr:MAG: carbon monoxide dehydrogenase [Acidobacteria bacterium RIFCSPLOWO2_02_FULL_68_18]OFW50541.1 MAG: carbon monoxide dehydrogenase [Acidobacteria bacterium RIFCSPLOWO2_12_FULL_68_19]
MSTIVKEKVGYVGRAMKRVEDPRLLKGLATYVDDLRLPGMLHAVVVRSPHAHARVRRVDGAAARALAGVAGVFSGADLNAHCGTVPCAASMPDLKAPKHTVLASDRVYFVGHPVAVVVAATPYAAVDAAEAVQVEYEPLPVVVDAEKALEKGSPLTHPDLGTNVAFTWHLAGGDIDAAFKNADRVVRQRMYHQRLTPMAIEPRGCVASFDRGSGTLTLWTSTQIPHLVRTLLPGMIGIAENKLRVVAPEVGGGFGSKLNLYVEEAICSYLAMRLGAPVKWIERRRENAAATIHGRDQIGDYEVAVSNDGTILGLRNRTIADLGSYLQLLTPAIPTLTGLVLTGSYKIPAVRMDVIGVYTHKMAADAYRGAGRPEATYLIERLMDLVAGETGQDPIELRRRHFPKPQEFPFPTATGLTYDSGDYDAALRKAMELARWDELVGRREARRRDGGLFGIGVSTYVEICGMGPSKAMMAGGWEWGCVRIEMSAKVTVITGATPHGQGQETSFAQIAADRLGVPIDDIVVLHGDTSIAHYGRDTYGSRATAVGGGALVMCIDRVVDKAKRLAAHLLGARPEQVEFQEGRFSLKGGAGRDLGWTDLAAEAYVAKNLPAGFEPGLEASAFFEPENFTFPFGTHICAVDLDRETGKVTIVKYVAVDDCGNQMNPLLIEGQLQGGIAQSIGQALFERTVYDENGQLLTGEFTDYALPRAEDIPEYAMGATVTPTTANPLGVKGVGEAGTIGATPAIANAVIDALRPLGVKHLDMPLTPEKIWRAINRR